MPFKKNFRCTELDDGKVIVHDVPIFAVCEKLGIKFSEKWIDDAVSYHQKGEENGMAWAMHIHHTNEPGRVPLAAGAFQNTRKGKVRTKDGEIVPGVICDLVFTDKDAAERAKLGQLLWRSPEIPMQAATGEKPARFKSLALLDRDAPHNDDLPMLTFRGSSVRFDRKADRIIPRASVGADPVIAFADTGDSIYALMEPTTMPNDTSKNDDGTLPFAEEEESSSAPESGGEDSGGGASWKSKLDALKSCKIPVEDIPDVKSAIEEFSASLGGEGETEEAPAEEAPIEDEPEIDPTLDGPADPMEESVEEEEEDDLPFKDESDAVLKLRDEVTQLKADMAAEKKLRLQAKLEQGVKDATEAAATRLAGKGVSREEIVAFASDEPLARRAKAIEKFADTMDAKLIDRTADFEEHVDFHASGNQMVPDEVMKFQAEGPDVYESALHQYRMWKQQPEDRRQRIPLDRWLEINSPNGSNPNFATGG